MVKEKVKRIPVQEVTHSELLFKIGDLYLELSRLAARVQGLLIALVSLGLVILICLILWLK